MMLYVLLKKIVIAEDEDAIAHLLGAALGDAGFLCLRARDGEEAIRLCKTDLPDLLILDVMLPKVDGIEVARRLKADARFSRIPILMTTSLASVEDRVVGLEAGADDYVPKPFDLREFMARVRALIRHSRRERERDPVTDLPGSTALAEQVEAHLKKGEAFSLVWVVVEGLAEALAVPGLMGDESLMAKVADVVEDGVRKCASQAFLAHTGAGDFAVLVPQGTEEAVCQALGTSFDQASPTLEGGKGLRLAMVGLNVARLGAKSVADIGRALLEARSKVPRRSTSAYVLWP